MKRLLLIVVVSFMPLAMATSLFAKDETLTITTYYPSPYGSYNQLSTNKFILSGSQAPDNVGSIIFNKQLSTTPSLPTGKTGELAFFGADGFKYHNGSTWVSLGSGGGGMKVVKAANPPFGNVSVDCTVGYKIVQCGTGISIDHVMEGYAGVANDLMYCDWSCYGSQTCSLKRGGVQAISYMMALCAKE